ncbi:MAG: Maltodextrin phosphorylase [Syntrophorhabdaceae bacterium PtaU1.Bin034]|nr:MAG: Maltodextrin phosphorylase [Syntrophorhabdaceae bacterium PtaU1.Bin034]
MSSCKVAYFSMEIGIRNDMPTYSGGLGILAGDTIRAAADLRVPMVAVTLLYRKGHFRQRLDQYGRQMEEQVEWTVEDFLKESAVRTAVTIEGRTVYIRPWRYDVRGAGGFSVPVYFLDTFLPENDEKDRTLTDSLYGGDESYRLCQEIVLGIGGIRILRDLGYTGIERFHLNEGHSGLLTLELLHEEAVKAGRASISEKDIAAVRERCVFTTHTPVAAGHDRFPLDLVSEVCEYCMDIINLKDILCYQGCLNMTYLALNLSRYVNGVAKRHGEVSSLMYAGYEIDSITNGVHAATWTSPSFQRLNERYIPGCMENAVSLRYALNIPKDEIWKAHREAKGNLLHVVREKTGCAMDDRTFTIGFARRATAYKRADLLFHDTQRLLDIAERAGAFQVIYAGKAHPRDEGGKAMIRRVFEARERLKPRIAVAYLEDYDMDLGRLITAGVDLWLNTPEPPLEASGTSGMKAAVNGVPSLSILDGWWIEGCLEGITGWAIGRDGTGIEANRSNDVLSLYGKLEHTIIPLFYRDRDRYVEVMRNAIALNGSFFNTHRMIQEYVLKAYFR